MHFWFRDRRRGNAAVTAISLTALLGFGALAVDLAWWRTHNLQLTVAVDAAAVGGVGYLDGTLERVQMAVDRTVWLANSNPLFTDHTFTAADVQTGNWDPDAQTFTAIQATDEDSAKLVNSIRVTSTASHIPTILALAAFGDREMATSAQATAFLPLGGTTSSMPCYLPLALPACLFPEEPTVNPAPIEVTLGNNNTDNISFALPNNVNANAVAEQFRNGCTHETIRIGDELQVMNGVASSVVSTVTKVINGQYDGAEAWPEEALGAPPQREEPNAFTHQESTVQPHRWGQSIQGAVALVDVGGEPGTCAGMENFTGPRVIKGFTYGALYDARNGDAMTKGFKLQLDFLTDWELGWRSSPSGIGNVTAPFGHPSLVR